jgi:hypothetical protein
VLTAHFRLAMYTEFEALEKKSKTWEALDNASAVNSLVKVTQRSAHLESLADRHQTKTDGERQCT